MSACSDALDRPPPAKPDVPIVLVAAGALVDPQGRVLIAQRPAHKAMGGLWEFPGGKIEAGETPEYALMRELKEELGIETRAGCFWPIGFSSHAYDDFHLLMPLFVCRTWRGEIAPREHSAIEWVRPVDLGSYPMPPADHPLVAQLRDILSAA